jgi:hypothetical protein
VTETAPPVAPVVALETAASVQPRSVTPTRTMTTAAAASHPGLAPASPRTGAALPIKITLLPSTVAAVAAAAAASGADPSAPPKRPRGRPPKPKDPNATPTEPKVPNKRERGADQPAAVVKPLKPVQIDADGFYDNELKPPAHKRTRGNEVLQELFTAAASAAAADTDAPMGDEEGRRAVTEAPERLRGRGVTEAQQRISHDHNTIKGTMSKNGMLKLTRYPRLCPLPLRDVEKERLMMGAMSTPGHELVKSYRDKLKTERAFDKDLRGLFLAKIRDVHNAYAVKLAFFSTTLTFVGEYSFEFDKTIQEKELDEISSFDWQYIGVRLNDYDHAILESPHWFGRTSVRTITAVPLFSRSATVDGLPLFPFFKRSTMTSDLFFRFVFHDKHGFPARLCKMMDEHTGALRVSSSVAFKILHSASAADIPEHVKVDLLNVDSTTVHSVTVPLKSSGDEDKSDLISKIGNIPEQILSLTPYTRDSFNVAQPNFTARILGRKADGRKRARVVLSVTHRSGRPLAQPENYNVVTTVPIFEAGVDEHVFTTGNFVVQLVSINHIIVQFTPIGSSAAAPMHTEDLHDIYFIHREFTSTTIKSKALQTAIDKAGLSRVTSVERAGYALTDVHRQWIANDLGLSFIPAEALRFVAFDVTDDRCDDNEFHDRLNALVARL